MSEIQILNNGDSLFDIRRKINENFQLTEREIEDVITDPLSQFGVNEGNVTDGVADLLTLTDGTLSFKVGGEYPNLITTSGDGVTTEIESVNDLYLQNLADGEYKIIVNGEASQLSSGEFYSQLTEPQNINNGDVWFNGEGAKQYLTNAPSVTAVTPKTTINFKCMGNIGDLYIAAGGGQYFYISRDAGTTWESRVLPANTSGFLSCVVKDDYFYFATSTSSIMRTAEGEDPEIFHKFADTFYPQKIKVINDLFVLTASGPTLSTSSDGQTWNTITIGTEPIIDVLYINDLYYIISRNGTIYTSEDLVTVTQKNKIVQSTYVQCAEVYKNTIIMGGISGSLYIYNLDTDEITLNNISSSEVILDMQVRPNGAMIFVGSNNMCKITYDFITFQNLYTSGGYLEHIYKDFIMGQAGSFLRINQTVQWFNYPWVPIGEVIISGGEVTYVHTYPYNSNGLHEASSSTFGLLRTAAVTDEMDCTCNDAVITPSNLYGLSNYRLANTSYEVDDKVGCPYHHNLQLKCTQAGTTSSEALDTKVLEVGATIEDGSVVWEVEELGTGSLDGKITNCITEIPNRIKIEFDTAGRISLLAGSEVFINNGSGFESYILPTDTPFDAARLWTNDNTRSLLVVYVPEWHTVVANAWDYVTHSTTPPTRFLGEGGYALWEDTTTGQLKITNNSGANWYNCSLPILNGRAGGANIGWIGNIDSVFNGFGFFGQKTFVLPGVKKLAPNGRNEDGTLKNTEDLITSVSIVDVTGRSCRLIFLDGTSVVDYGVINYFEQDVRPIFEGQNGTWFDTLRNMIFVTNDYGATWQPRANWIYLGTAYKADASSNFINLIPKRSFRAVDYNDLRGIKSYVKEKYVNGTSWYRLYSDGWCVQGGRSGSAMNATVYFLKPFKNINYSVTGIKNRGEAKENPVSVSSITTTSATFSTSSDYAPIVWTACGYI